MKRKIEVAISGTISGFAEEGETPEHARAAIVFEAEQRVNMLGDVRAHFALMEETPRGNVSIRDFCRSALVGRHLGMTANDLWAINPGGWSQEEIGDTLERMIGDGEASFNDTAGERFFIRA